MKAWREGVRAGIGIPIVPSAVPLSANASVFWGEREVASELAGFPKNFKKGREQH